MRIQNNIAALNSYRQLGTNNNAVSKNLEKLSSGYRVNRAGDDAAGLAISEKMKAQITGLETAQKNANDGISLVQTAEGALTEVHSMLNRMVELADQSANGTYDNEVDRANLQKEVESLKSEIDRISEGTNFNGINLLDGSLSGSSTANGLTGASIVNYKGAVTAATGIAAASTSVNYYTEDTINVDGTEVKIDWSQLTDADKAVLSAIDGSDANKTKAAAKILQDTINESINNYNKANGTQLNNIKIEATDASNITFASGQKDGASKLVIEGDSAGNSLLYHMVGADTIANTGQITTADPVATLQPTPADVNGKFTMKLDDQTLEVNLTGVTGAGNIATQLQSAIDAALNSYDTANGLTGEEAQGITARAAVDNMSTIQVSLNEDGALEFINNSGMRLSFEDKNDGEFAKNLGISQEGKIGSNGGLTLQIGDTSEDFNKLTVNVDAMDANSLGIDGIDISTQTGAANAVDKIKAAINTVSSTRGDLGAIQNRLEHTINNLSVTTENMTAAESRIRDTDMASEMMEYTKNSILVQSAQSMLAQANQLPQGVLQLLQ